MKSGSAMPAGNFLKQKNRLHKLLMKAGTTTFQISTGVSGK
jgi:hypothetical protein